MEEKNTKETIVTQINDFLAAKLPADWDHWSLAQRREFWAGDRTAGVCRRKRVCSLEIWEELLGQDRIDFEISYARHINNIIKSIPYWRQFSRIECGPLYGSQRGFVYRPLDAILGLDTQ